jgi:hypothetical protein
MITLQLCQRHLNEIAEFAPDEKLQSEAQKCVRLLDRRWRKALKPWATAELSKLSRPGSRLLLQDPHGVARRMTVFQAALGAIDEATTSPGAGS